MASKPKQPAGPPMTLGNMRQLDVQRLLVSCLNPDCLHSTLFDVSHYDDDLEIPSFTPRMRCSQCVGKRIDARQNWNEQPPSERLIGKVWR
jgi:hypothetical protein